MRRSGARKSQLRLTPPLSWVYGNVLFTESVSAHDAWALFEVDTHSYERLSAAAKKQKWLGLARLIVATQADHQWLRVQRSWDIDDYCDQLESHRVGPHHEAHAAYLAEHRSYLERFELSTPALFLAVRLQPPSRDLSARLEEILEGDVDAGGTGQALGRAVNLGGRRFLAVEDLESLRVEADRVHQRLTGAIREQIRPARCVDVQWLVRRSFTRGLGEPRIDGLHEPAALTFERNGRATLAPLTTQVGRWMKTELTRETPTVLRCDGELGTSYQSFLVCGTVPDAVFPDPDAELMFAGPDDLPFGVDISLNCRFVPNPQAKGSAERQVQRADQQALEEDRGSTGASDEALQRTNQARDLKSFLNAKQRWPLLLSTLSVCVWGSSPQEVRERRARVRKSLGSAELHLEIPAGSDQEELFCQHFPGQPTRVAGYENILTPLQVASFMPTATHAVGWKSGFLFGFTLSGSAAPVLFDHIEASANDLPTAGVFLAPQGGGKTVAVGKIKYEGVLQHDALVFDVDFKGDHHTHELSEIAPLVDRVELGEDQRELRGSLDPLRVAPAHLRKQAAEEFLLDLVPQRAGEQWEVAIAKAVTAALQCGGREPSLLDVLGALGAGDEFERAAGEHLTRQAQSGFTQLAFPEPGRPVRPFGELPYTYLRVRGLVLPEPGVERDKLGASERVGMATMRLIALLGTRIMGDRDRLKIYDFDEFHMLVEDPVGRALVNTTQRMGRSELALPIISTQRCTDAMTDRNAMDALIGFMVVLRQTSEQEAARCALALGQDPEDPDVITGLMDLQPGEGLMRDHWGRCEFIKIDLITQRLTRALNTNPKTRDAHPAPA